MIIPKPPAKRRFVCVQRYFEEKYEISLNQPNSPLLRDSVGRLYPVEAIWIRICLF